jgi:hypothetical protein
MSWSFRIGPRVLCVAVAFGLVAPARLVAQPVEPQADDRPADPQPPAAPAPAGYFLLPVPGGEAVFERLGIHTEERGFALVLFARALHGPIVSNPSGSLAITFTEVFGPLTVKAAAPVLPSDGAPVTLLAPFSDPIWRRMLALDPGADLFTSIVKSRGALLVAAAALETGPGVREWLAREPRLLAQIVREWPGSFAQAAPALSRTERGWLVPGDERAWASLVGAPPARAEEFLRRLLERDEGQLARFFATLSLLSGERRAALVQDAPGEDPATTLGSLYAAARDADAPWPPNGHPFQLSYADLQSVLHALSDLSLDRLPVTAGQWPALVSSQIGSRQDAAALLEREPAAAPLAATVRALLRGTPRERRDHIAMLSMARRIWDGNAPAAAQADLIYALGHYRRFRGLLLMLDRIGVRTPQVWARLVDAARHIDGGSGSERGTRLSLVQAALAIVERSAIVGSIGLEACEAVLLALADEVTSPAAVPVAVRQWLLDSFLPALPPLARPDRYSGATAYESRVLQALGGPPSASGNQVTWEGLDYTVDHSAAEHQRILQIRGQLPTPGLDAALAQSDPKLLIAALMALVYAPALGDPEGAVTLSPDVVQRHDITGVRSMGRDFAWSLAVERSGSGGPWHVAGSLMGLDLALARSALRRLSADEMPPVPTINLNDELTLARTAVALRPRELDDDTHAAIAAALSRGRMRVRAAARDPEAVLRLMAQVAAPVAVRNAVPWTVASFPNATPALFSLRDMVWLGEPGVEPATLARWGVIGDAVDGRLAPRFDPPTPWDRLAGRPDTGVLATQVPDLTLRLAEVTAALGMPAGLIPSLLLYATQDYWHEVEARFSDDWPALVRGAAGLPASRVEDYIAALASQGPLRPR